MQSGSHEVILEWLQRAIGDLAVNRREHTRFPFFRRVTTPHSRHDDDSVSQSSQALFCRDISARGIGLLHNFCLQTDELPLEIPTTGSQRVSVTTHIRWCQHCGGSWYTSGGNFTDLSTSQATSLLLPTVLAETDRRIKQRFPFFCPVTIAAGHAQDLDEVHAISRDISGAGIGLIHNATVPKQNVILTIPRTSGSSFEIGAEIMWCGPCGDGWFLSGAKFRHLMLEQLEDRLL